MQKIVEDEDTNSTFIECRNDGLFFSIVSFNTTVRPSAIINYNKPTNQDIFIDLSNVAIIKLQYQLLLDTTGIPFGRMRIRDLSGNQRESVISLASLINVITERAWIINQFTGSINFDLSKIVSLVIICETSPLIRIHARFISIVSESISGGIGSINTCGY